MQTSCLYTQQPLGRQAGWWTWQLGVGRWEGQFEGAQGGQGTGVTPWLPAHGPSIQVDSMILSFLMPREQGLKQDCEALPVTVQDYLMVADTSGVGGRVYGRVYGGQL